MADYRTEHARSIADPEGFWGEQARLVTWAKRPTRVLDAALAAAGSRQARPLTGSPRSRP